MLETLRADPQAYGDEDIKVWVRAHAPDHPDQFFDDLEKHLVDSGFFRTFHDLVQASQAAPLPPGQHFLIFQAPNPADIDVDLGRVSRQQPVLVFQDVSFTAYRPLREYRGALVGDSRPFVAAARRALKDTGGKNWFGGIGEFAAKYLAPPQSKKPAMR